MDERGGYGQFCPVSMASEILCSRWTTLVVRELLCGSTRFNDLRRGVPKMSPALLSKRLKELQRAGNRHGVTQAERFGRLSPLRVRRRIAAIDHGARQLGSSLGGIAAIAEDLDPSLLMWDVRRCLDVKLMPNRRCTIQFLYRDLEPPRQSWWLVVDGGAVDVCNFDPGHELDLLVRSSLRSMTAIWMGLTTIKKELESGDLELDGDPSLARSMQQWLGLSAFAPQSRRVQ